MMENKFDFDFDFNFDFDLDENEENLLKKRIKFDLQSSAKKIFGKIIPKKGESIRFVSPAGGFSSCSVVLAIAKTTKIKSIKISTLRCGKKEAKALAALCIPDVEIVCGGIALENAEKYNYAIYLGAIAEEKGWKISYKRNHSKVILIDADVGKITIETSSNFNENPQIEQFCITNDEDVYNFYLGELKKNGVFT